MTTKCEICKSLDLNTERLLVTDHWIVTLAQDQGYLGRCYVTTRKHKQHLHELDPSEWQDLNTVICRLEDSISKTFGATLYNWACMMNNAYQESDPMPHVHWHVRPRYIAPVTFRGVIYSDKDFGHHYDREHRVLLDDSKITAITTAIKSNL